MWKKIVLCFVFLLSTVSVYGDIFIFTYEEALDMALHDLLQVQEMDFQIRSIQEQRTQIYDELRTFERGGTMGNSEQELIDYLNQELWLLDNQLWQIMSAQTESTLGVELSFQAILPNLLNLLYTGDEGFVESFNLALFSTIQGMITSNDLAHARAQVDAHRNIVFGELNTLHNSHPQDRDIAQTRGEIEESDRQMQNLRLQQEQTKQARERALRDAIVSINELETAIAITNANIVLLESSMIRTTRLREFGFVSQSYMRTSELALTQAQMELNALYTRKSDAVRVLNYIIGEPLSQLTVIKMETPELESPASLDANISQLVSSSAVIQRLQLDVDRAQAELQAYENTNNTSNVRRGDNENSRRNELREILALTETARDHAKITVEVALRQGFNRFEQLIAQSEALAFEYEVAQDVLVAAQINFDLGRIIQHDLDLAVFTVFRVRQEMKVLHYQKWALLFLLENPSLFF